MKHGKNEKELKKLGGVFHWHFYPITVVIILATKACVSIRRKLISFVTATVVTAKCVRAEMITVVKCYSVICTLINICIKRYKNMYSNSEFQAMDS